MFKILCEFKLFNRNIFLKNKLYLILINDGSDVGRAGKQQA